MRRLIPLLLVTALAGCGDGGSGGSGNSGVPIAVTPTPSPTPTPTPSPTPTPTPSPSPSPTPTSSEPPTGSAFEASAAQLYASPPDIPNCVAGTLKPEVGQRVLATLNEIRALHGLPAVTYASAEEAGEMQASLMFAANQQLSHTPPTSWTCYTGAGATAAGQSNIYLGLGNGLAYSQDADLIAGWLTDTDNLVANNIGHRRWLLYPFLNTVAYGRVAGLNASGNRLDAASIKVINATTAAPASLPDFVAYPYQDYPARYFSTSALLSFMVIADKTNPYGANSTVDFSAATVTVTQRGGTALTVSNISYDNTGYGLPNNIQRQVAGLASNTIYDVAIGNVKVGGATKSYSYYFRIMP